MLWVLAAIVGIVYTGIAAYVGGKKQEAQVTEIELKASALEELSKVGGYYDQVLDSLKSDLADIEADRADAAKLLAMSTTELAGQVSLSQKREKTQLTGLEAQIVGISYEGATQTGSIKARAGAGNLAQEGSILRRAEAVARITKMNVGVVQGQVDYTKALGEQERLSLTNDITKANLGYQDVLRGLGIRAQTDIANVTKTLFEQSQGTKEAARLKSTAQWLEDNAWIGVATATFEGLGIALGIAL